MTIRLRYKVSLGEQQMLSAVFSGRPPSPSLPPSLPRALSLSLSLARYMCWEQALRVQTHVPDIQSLN